MNPAAGGGRAGALLPQIERELAARGVSCRVAATEGLEHAGELAAEAVRDGEVAVSVGGDGIAGAVAAGIARAYGGGMYLAPAAEIDDGLLDVVLIEDSSRLRFLAGLPSVFRGTHVRRPSVRVLRAREVEFLADRTFVLYADGDPVAPLPVVVRAVPRALRVLVPR